MDVFEKYRDHTFRRHAAETVARANIILKEMGEQGYVLTLRQLYYQFVRRNWLPNKDREYKRLGRILTDAREAGVVSWTAIEDRHRQPNVFGNRPDPKDALKGVERRLTMNPWLDQDDYVEVWVEKDALAGVVERPCGRFRVNFMACKGYLSASEAWRAGLRFQMAIAQGKRPHLIHLADHDPSGLDMTRDNGERLDLFARQGVDIRRVALNMDQVEQYDPPPNPAKQTDSRFEGYKAEHGDESWELDALEPSVLDALIADSVQEYIDPVRWQASLDAEAEARKPLARISEEWDAIMQRVML